jgi:carbohydrate diacid regulator
MRDVVSKKEMGVVDESETIIACSDPDKTGTRSNIHAIDVSELESCEIFIRDGFTYKPFGNPTRPEYVVFVEGDNEIALTQAQMISVSLGMIKQHQDDKYDRNNFIKNIVLDNVLPGDVAVKSRELHFNAETSRVVFLINLVSAADISAYEIILNLFPDKSKDFVFNINDGDIVLVKELKNNTDIKDLEKLARSISDTLSSEFFAKVNVGIGAPVVGIKELARSFKEAQIAIEVGKVFDTDKSIVCYSNLGIARLIYHLPTTLCNTFLKEVFKKGSIESLDHETLFTIQRFFENNLNVSETSRKLFVHRNTLVYRLDKIKKLTGLDLRDFEDAIVFKIALMVRKYLSNDPTKF